MMRFAGPSWAKPHSELPDWNAQHHAYVDSLFRARKSGEVSVLAASAAWEYVGYPGYHAVRMRFRA